VLHLHDKERTGQSRGKPIVASVLREFRMLGKYGTTELQANIAGSLIAAVLESNMSQEAVAELFTSGSDRLGVAEGDAEGYYRKSLAEYQATLKGGAIIPIPVGTKLTGFNPGRPNQAFDAFVTSFLRYIAAGLNLPYELVSKDFSKVNYSSARAALLEAWRHFLGRRRWLKDHWLDPSYNLWMEEAVNTGQLDAPDFYENRYAYTRCRWIFSGRGWVDPVKEANAAKIRIAAGLSTHEIECAEQGNDWEEVFEQSARERQRRIDLGLPLSTEGDPQATEPETPDQDQPEEGTADD